MFLPLTSHSSSVPLYDRFLRHMPSSNGKDKLAEIKYVI
jgi:hypothetical protein